MYNILEMIKFEILQHFVTPKQMSKSTLTLKDTLKDALSHNNIYVRLKIMLHRHVTFSFTPLTRRHWILNFSMNILRY